MSNFRNTGLWKTWRIKIADKQNNIDPITQSKLRKGYNCHHLDLNKQNYADISDESHFVCLNKKSHEMIHFLYTYYINDKSILDRVKTLLDKMEEINK